MSLSSQTFHGFVIGDSAVVVRRSSTGKTVEVHYGTVVRISEATGRVTVYSKTFRKTKRRSYVVNACNIAPADSADWLT